MTIHAITSMIALFIGGLWDYYNGNGPSGVVQITGAILLYGLAPRKGEGR